MLENHRQIIDKIGAYIGSLNQDTTLPFEAIWPVLERLSDHKENKIDSIENLINALEGFIGLDEQFKDIVFNQKNEDALIHKTYAQILLGCNILNILSQINEAFKKLTERVFESTIQQYPKLPKLMENGVMKIKAYSSDIYARIDSLNKHEKDKENFIQILEKFQSFGQLDEDFIKPLQDKVRMFDHKVQSNNKQNEFTMTNGINPITKRLQFFQESYLASSRTYQSNPFPKGSASDKSQAIITQQNDVLKPSSTNFYHILQKLSNINPHIRTTPSKGKDFRH